MNNILPPFFKKIDTWLLLNYPRVWASRVHNFLYILLLIFVVGLLIGFLFDTPFDGTSYYLSNTIVPYFTIGLVILTGVVIWLTRFRTKLAPLNYKENLLLTAGFTLLSIFMFVTAWSVTEGHRLRIANSYNKTDIENDLMIATILDETHNFSHVIDTIEDIKIGDYVIKAAETKRLKQNLDYFYAMRSTIDSSEVLNSLAGPEMNEEGAYDTFRKKWFQNRNQRILNSKIAAIRALKTIPDSMVEIYNQLLVKQLSDYTVRHDPNYNQTFDTKISDQDFDGYQLHKIAPSRTYLMQKYKCESFRVVRDNLKTVYALQRQPIMERLMFKSAYYWDYVDPLALQHENFYAAKDEYGNNTKIVYKAQIRQSYADALRKAFRVGVESGEFYPLLNQAIWFILALTMLILFIIVFGLRHSLFSFLGFIVFISLLGLMQRINTSEINVLGYLMLTIIAGLTIFLGFNKDADHKSWGQLFLPISIFFTFFFMNICYQDYMDGTIHDEMNRPQYYHLSLESIVMNYGLFVLPLLFMIYNRLAFLPKSK